MNAADVKRVITIRTHRSTIELERAIREYLNMYNENPEPFVWTNRR